MHNTCRPRHRIRERKPTKLVSNTKHKASINWTPLTFTKRNCGANESHLAELACTTITAPKLPKLLWEPTVAYAAYLGDVIHETKSRRNGLSDTMGLWHGRKPNASHYENSAHPSGYCPKDKKSDEKCYRSPQRRTYVDFDEELKSIKYYNTDARNMLTSRNLCFLSQAEPFSTGGNRCRT